MIRFRQKIFFAPLAILGSAAGQGGLLLAGTGVTAIQGRKANKMAEQQGEDAAAEQARSNRTMEKIAKQQAAEQRRALQKIAKQNQNPTIVPMMDSINTINNQPPVSSALDYPRQAAYSNTSVLSNLSQKMFAGINMKSLGQTGYDILKGIRGTKSKVAGGSGVLTGNWLRSGLAMGAGMTGMNYLVDKGIQLDRKRSGMPELEQKEITDKEKKKKKRALITAGLGAAAAVGGGIAAKRGALGTSWKNWADRNLTKQSLLNRAKAEPAKAAKALKEHALSKSSLAFGAVFAVPTVAGYMSEKKAYKNQIADQQNQKTYSEEQDQQGGEKKKHGLLKAAGIATGLAAGTMALGRRGYLGGKAQMTTNNIIARTGKVFKNQRLMDVGAKGWGEGSAKVRANNLAAREAGEKAGFFDFGKKADIKKRADEIFKADAGRAVKNQEYYQNNILTRQSKATDAIKHPLRTVLSGVDKVTRFDKAGGQKSANELVNNIRKQGEASGNVGTQKVVDFLDNHKTLAVAGSVGVGSLLFKPFTWGDKLVRSGTKAVDKNAFAYENRKQEEVN